MCASSAARRKGPAAFPRSRPLSWRAFRRLRQRSECPREPARPGLRYALGCCAALRVSPPRPSPSRLLESEPTAAFSITDHVLLRPLPFAERGAWSRCGKTSRIAATEELSPGNFRDWKRLRPSNPWARVDSRGISWARERPSGSTLPWSAPTSSPRSACGPRSAEHLRRRMTVTGRSARSS